LGKSVAGEAQLLPPAMDLPGTNRRTPGDIGDDRAWRKRRSDNRPLMRAGTARFLMSTRASWKRS
jgi:hypothetical protein